jgi:hypothetical protein
MFAAVLLSKNYTATEYRSLPISTCHRYLQEHVIVVCKNMLVFVTVL